MADKWQNSQWEGRRLVWCHPSTTLGTVSSGCGWELAFITRCCVAWGKFSELLPSLTFCSFPITPIGRVHNLCVHASKTWTSTSSDLHRLQRNDRPMVRWMCGVITLDQVSSFLERMQLDDLEKVLPTRRLGWHGHVECIDGWLKNVQKLNPVGGCGCGRPKKTWSKVIHLDGLG